MAKGVRGSKPAGGGGGGTNNAEATKNGDHHQHNNTDGGGKASNDNRNATKRGNRKPPAHHNKHDHQGQNREVRLLFALCRNAAFNEILLLPLQHEDSRNHSDKSSPSYHEDQNASPNVATTETKKQSEHPPKVQPTSEQLMIAQIIGDSSDDAGNQRRKIQQVMDITGKVEDEVATALFDSAWDQNRAVEMLLEGGGSGAWEETGKKKKKKQTAEEKVRFD